MSTATARITITTDENTPAEREWDVLVEAEMDDGHVFGPVELVETDPPPPSASDTAKILEALQYDIDSGGHVYEALADAYRESRTRASYEESVI